MKIITYLFILILFSFYADAQGELLSKSRDEIRDHFKKENIYPKEKNTLYGAASSDAFYTTNNKKVCCGYDKSKICVEVIALMNLSLIDSIKNNFNTIYLKRSGETFPDDVWADKASRFKVHLETMLSMVYLEYLPINKSYIIY